MIGSSHLRTTREAFDVYASMFRADNPNVQNLCLAKEVVAQKAVDTDHFNDTEFVNVWGDKDNPHNSSIWDIDDEPHYSKGGRNFCAFNHFIDIKKGPGKFDDYDGYSYEHGSANKQQYQFAKDAAGDWLEWIAGAISSFKVDEGIKWWFNDEYVHVLGHEWYEGCSPSTENYCYFQDLGKYRSKEGELVARFPRAENVRRKGKGIPYSVFMPVDNLARFWYSEFKKWGRTYNLGPVMHAIQDASVPHHAAGYMGNWHGEYEDRLKSFIPYHIDNANVINVVKSLVTQWNRIDDNPPSHLAEGDFGIIPARNWEIETLVTWVALNACNEYINTYTNFAHGFRVNSNSMANLTTIALAMSTLLLVKASDEIAIAVPPQTRFIGNKNSKELHQQKCAWAGLILEDNMVFFRTIKDALNEGYNGCHHCLRWYDTG